MNRFLNPVSCVLLALVVHAESLAPRGRVFAEDFADRSPRPNIVFILADDLGWSDTTLYGTTTFYRTPNVERLAQRGMTFTRAYSASPLCSPTRAAILTGLSPARTGITTPNCHLPQEILTTTIGRSAPPDQKSIAPVPPTRLKREYRTLAESLRDAGYATGHFGKWHLGPEPYSPLEQGFDVDVPHHSGPGPAGSFVAPWKFRDFRENVPAEHLEDRMAAEAAAWIERNKDRPFFLNYWMFSVHAPFDAKRALIEKYRERAMPTAPQRSPTYAAMIESMDDAIGTLLDTLDRLQLADRTIVIFTSDNGGNMYNEVDGTTPTSNTPLRGGKATLFEGGTRVPGVVVWPGIAKPGSRSDAPIQSEDYYPTLLEGAGLKPAPEQRFDGVSILPALRGGALNRAAIYQYFPHSPGVPDWLPPAVSAHSGDWKLIRIFHGGERGTHRHLLFDLKDDLGERRNLAADRQDVVAALDAGIETFLADTQAVVPRPNPAFDPARYRPELEGKAKPKAAPAPKAAPSASADASDPALLGWKARQCRAVVHDGVLTLTQDGTEPFLGVAPGKLAEGAELRFRIKCAGGEGKLVWLPASVKSPAEPAGSVKFVVAADEWTVIRSSLPARPNMPGIVRLFPPAGRAPVQLDWIELLSGGKAHRWDF